jgi:hypothetical protein
MNAIAKKKPINEKAPAKKKTVVGGYTVKKVEAKKALDKKGNVAKKPVAKKAVKKNIVKNKKSPTKITMSPRERTLISQRIERDFFMKVVLGKVIKDLDIREIFDSSGVDIFEYALEAIRFKLEMDFTTRKKFSISESALKKLEFRLGSKSLSKPRLKKLLTEDFCIEK